MQLPFRFSLRSSGRCGDIACACGERTLTVVWELSGSGGADILLAPINLTRWDSGEELSMEEQLEILSGLRVWLEEQGIKADITPPPTKRVGPNHCVRAGCTDLAWEGVA